MSNEESEAKTILIVDDNVNIVELVYDVLHKGYVVDTANSGKQAVDLHKRNQYQIALVDISLGEGMDGFQVTKAIKEENPLTEVIIITGNNTTENAISAIRAGANDYLPKPLGVDTLQETVERAAQRYSLSAGTNDELRRIGHDINNDLAVVIGYAELTPSMPDKAIKYAESIGTSANSIRELVSRMQSLLIRKEPVKVSVEFPSIYQEYSLEGLTGEEKIFRIVYIDDQPRLRDLMATRLTQTTNIIGNSDMGLFGHPSGKVRYDVKTFRSVEEFLKEYNNLDYIDCLITDREMPEIDGFQLLEIINDTKVKPVQRREDYNNIGCVVMCTGQASQTKVDLIGELGAIYLPKEINPKDVEPYLHQYITDCK